MIGTKGSGKSSTGNCLLGENKFDVFIGTKNGTACIQTERKECNGTDVLVVDTPGVHNVQDINENMKKLIVSDNVVYAIVIAIGRYTSLDKEILHELENKHKDILKKTIIIFTRKKDLESYPNIEDRTIHVWLESAGTLSKFISRHQLKFCVFENVDVDSISKAQQVKEFIELCKEIDHTPDFCSREPNKRNITVAFDEMKQAFGDKGVEFFEAKYKR